MLLWEQDSGLRCEILVLGRFWSFISFSFLPCFKNIFSFSLLPHHHLRKKTSFDRGFWFWPFETYENRKRFYHYILFSFGILLHQQGQTKTHDLLYLWVFSLTCFSVFPVPWKAPGNNNLYHRSCVICFSIMVYLIMFVGFDQFCSTHFPRRPVPAAYLIPLLCV